MAESTTLTAEGFVEKSLNHFMSAITDKVLLMIQNDHSLMQEYLDLVRVQDGKRLNVYIGKLINEKFRLDDVMESGQPAKGKPQSTLIKETYTKHCLKRGLGPKNSTPQLT